MAQTEKPHERTASTDQRTSWSWRRLFGKDDSSSLPITPPLEEDTPRPGVVRRISRKVVPGLPRPGTFKRQQSELRDRLEPTRPNTEERRAVSMDRRRNTPSRDASTPGRQSPRLSAPELLEKTETIDSVLEKSSIAAPVEKVPEEQHEFVDVSKETSHAETNSFVAEAFDDMISDELEHRWILNLSMHFRDKSKREKFFVTFAETPTHLRRVTVSLDYRDAPPGSLEEELQFIKFQREKSARIYEAIRESLQDIQFYDTVTNLKLQTENERLHVHVVEDVAEIIAYPPIKAINHLRCRRVREDQIVFDSHLSGFVYKVRVDGQVFIKKEIPGPDTVDEFLYEINALHQLAGSRSVIQFGGVVLDNKGELVKGLLISFAEQGALIDVIYDGEGQIPWKRRERWAKQVVQGLSEIHEAGFVQGDFTLSNIVVDEDDNAKIIDINRRGCPVGWEPPEVAALIENNQRISMYIGVKSDLFQLGMVLYALAFQYDEPETQPRPLNLSIAPTDVPEYFLDICERCLSDDPRMRSQAAVLYTLFPEVEETHAVHDQPIPPIVVDAHYHYRDEESEDMHDSGIMSSIHNQNYGERFSGPYNHANGGESGDRDYPRRGRSPPREEVVTSDIPYSSSRYPEAQVEDVENSTSSRTNGEGDLRNVDEGRHLEGELQFMGQHSDDNAADQTLPVAEIVNPEPQSTSHPRQDIADDEHANQKPRPVDNIVYAEDGLQSAGEGLHDKCVEEPPQSVGESPQETRTEENPQIVHKISDEEPQHIEETVPVGGLHNNSNIEALAPTTKSGQGLVTTTEAEAPAMKNSNTNSHITTEENERQEEKQEPRKTAAVNSDSNNNNNNEDEQQISEKPYRYPDNLDLVGVGGVDTALFTNLPSNLDDDFTSTTGGGGDSGIDDNEMETMQQQQTQMHHLESTTTRGDTRMVVS